MSSTLFGAETAADTSANDMDAPIDDRACNVIAWAWKVGQRLPAIASRVIDGKIVAVRRPAARDIDPSVMHQRYAG